MRSINFYIYAIYYDNKSSVYFSQLIFGVEIYLPRNKNISGLKYMDKLSTLYLNTIFFLQILIMHYILYINYHYNIINYYHYRDN